MGVDFKRETNGIQTGRSSSCVGVFCWGTNMEPEHGKVFDSDLGSWKPSFSGSIGSMLVFVGVYIFSVTFELPTLLPPQMGFLFHLHLSEEGVGSEDARSRKYNKLSRKTQRVRGPRKLGGFHRRQIDSQLAVSETEAIRFEFNDFFKEHRNLAQLFELLG